MWASEVGAIVEGTREASPNGQASTLVVLIFRGIRALRRLAYWLMFSVQNHFLKVCERVRRACQRSVEAAVFAFLTMYA